VQSHKQTTQKFHGRNKKKGHMRPKEKGMKEDRVEKRGVAQKNEDISSTAKTESSSPGRHRGRQPIMLRGERHEELQRKTQNQTCNAQKKNSSGSQISYKMCGN